jgi:hypothetical protein
MIGKVWAKNDPACLIGPAKSTAPPELKGDSSDHVIELASQLQLNLRKNKFFKVRN